MVDLEKLDAESWPGAEHLHGKEAVLTEGDILVVPYGWWIQSEYHGNNNVALRTLLRQPKFGFDLALHASQAEVEAGKTIEAILGEAGAVGVNRAKRFCQQMLAGDQLFGDVLDFNNFQKAETAQQVRELADAFLASEDAWKVRYVRYSFVVHNFCYIHRDDGACV